MMIVAAVINVVAEVRRSILMVLWLILSVVTRSCLIRHCAHEVAVCTLIGWLLLALIVWLLEVSPNGLRGVVSRELLLKVLGRTRGLVLWGTTVSDLLV